MTLRIRGATLADVPAITALYAREVREAVATYEYDAPSEAQMEQRVSDLLGQGFPYLVAELDDRFAGYAYAGSYRSRSGYRWTVEESVYVDTHARGHGVAAALLTELIRQCESLGFRQMVAVIGEPGNGASVALHEKLGFRTVGVFTGLGRKHGRWLDTVQMQRALGQGDQTAPYGDTS